MGVEIFLTPSSYGAFQPFSSNVGGKRVEESHETNVERVEERVVEGGDCEIIGSSKKRVAPKQKAIPKKKKTSKKKAAVKIEGEAKGEEVNRMWEDSEVLQLISLKGEMEPEFVRNGKKQGKNFLP
jgi:hypothetical protein